MEEQTENSHAMDDLTDETPEENPTRKFSAAEEDLPVADRQVLPKELWPTLKRLDDLLAETDDVSRQRAGMGIRLALGMAQELRDGLPLGTDTAALVTEWAEKYGQESVDAAVAIARDFLVKPDEMRKALGARLGMGTGEKP